MENTDGAAAVAFTAQDPTVATSSRISDTGLASLNPSQEGLPFGVILDIFQHLDSHSLLKCRLVGSGFQSLIDSTASLQYKIELAVAGQRDGSYGDMFTRREMLKVHQKRWDGLQWTEVLRVPMVSDYWRLCGGVLAQASSKPYTLHVKRIPSRSRGIKEKNWIVDLSTLLGEEARMGKFGMDPGQDLLVITARIEANESLRIHLLTLSKGERHPLTSEPYLVPHGLVSGALEWVDICHDFLSIDLEDGVMLWNWKTGQVLMHIVSYRKVRSMVFLNERYVLMAIMGKDYPYLLAVDFLAEPPEQRGLDKLENYFTFRFPDIPDSPPLYDHEDYIGNIDIDIARSNPLSTGADTDLPVPFSMLPQNRLFVVYLVDDSNLGEDLCFAILEASFLSLIKTGLRLNDNRFDWSAWGPEHSRILPGYSYSCRWLLPSHGTRLAMKRSTYYGLFVYVYDFNQLGCRNKRQDSDEETPGNVNVSESSSEIIEGRSACILAPTSITPGIFIGEVETRLGYRVTSCSFPKKPHVRSTSAMCTEDAIIIVDKDNGMYEIYTV